MINFLIATELVNTDPNTNPRVNNQLDSSEETPSPIISLRNANLKKVNLSGANLSGADLSGADLSGAILSKANLKGAYLMYAVLKEAKLQQTILHDARLREADLTGANLTRADLTGSDLMGTNLMKTQFKDAEGLNNKYGSLNEKVALAKNWENAYYNNNSITSDLKRKIQPKQQKMCGQHTDETYIVSSPKNTLGIRCVMRIVDKKKITRLIWYGEGTKNGKEYQHIGKALLKNSKFVGYTLSIRGEQEKLPIDLRYTSSKKDIQLNESISNENWRLVTSEESRKYKPISRSLSNCGNPKFSKYKVYPVLPKRERLPNDDWGIRCVLPNESTKDKTITWFGTGQWENKPYYHLGIYLPEEKGRSVDICNLLKDSFCYAVEPGFLKLESKGVVGFDVTGDWIEKWRR